MVCLSTSDRLGSWTVGRITPFEFILPIVLVVLVEKLVMLLKLPWHETTGTE